MLPVTIMIQVYECSYRITYPVLEPYAHFNYSFQFTLSLFLCSPATEMIFNCMLSRIKSLESPNHSKEAQDLKDYRWE